MQSEASGSGVPSQLPFRRVQTHTRGAPVSKRMTPINNVWGGREGVAGEEKSDFAFGRDRGWPDAGAGTRPERVSDNP